jgi:hypothetical protein
MAMEWQYQPEEVIPGFKLKLSDIFDYPPEESIEVVLETAE